MDNYRYYIGNYLRCFYFKKSIVDFLFEFERYKIEKMAMLRINFFNVIFSDFFSLFLSLSLFLHKTLIDINNACALLSISS